MIITVQTAIAQFELLKEQMGIEEEPDIAWSEFGKGGVEVSSLKEVKASPEQLLTWKGELCVLYIRDQRGLSTTSNYKFHITECGTVSGMRKRGMKHRYVVTNRADDFFAARPQYSDGTVGKERLVRMSVCMNCLQQINWEDYEWVDWDQRKLLVRKFKIQDYLEVYQNRTLRASKRKRAAKPAPPPPKPPQPPAPDAPLGIPGWAYKIPDEDFRAALVYLEAYKRLSEAELSRMVGGPRRARRFDRYCDKLPASCPFTIQVGTLTGQKTYRAQRR